MTSWRSLLTAAAILSWAGESVGQSAAAPPAAIEAPAAKIPLERISGSQRDRVVAIIEKPLVHRLGVVEVIPGQPAIMEWLVDHPHVVVEFWRALGLEVTDMTPTEDGYVCKDGRSSIRFHVMLDEPGLRILYCVGETRQPPFPTLSAELVIVQRYRFTERPDGRKFVVQQMEGFASAKGPALKTVMKLTKSASHRIVDQCLQEMTVYFAVIGRVMEVRPKWASATIAKVRTKYPSADFDRLETALAALPGLPSREARTAARAATFEPLILSDFETRPDGERPSETKKESPGVTTAASVAAEDASIETVESAVADELDPANHETTPRDDASAAGVWPTIQSVLNPIP